MAILTTSGPNLAFQTPDVHQGFNSIAGGIAALGEGLQKRKLNQERDRFINAMEEQEQAEQEQAMPILPGDLYAQEQRQKAQEREREIAAMRARAHGVDTAGYDAMRNRQMQEMQIEAAAKAAELKQKQELEKAKQEEGKQALKVYRGYQEKYGALANFANKIDEIIEEKGLEGGKAEIDSMKGSVIASITKIMAGSTVTPMEYNNVLRMLLDEKELEKYNEEIDNAQNMDRNAIMSQINKAIENPLSLLASPAQAALLAAKANLIGLDSTEVQGALNNALNKTIKGADTGKIMQVLDMMLPQDYYTVASMAAQKQRDNPRDYSRYANQTKQTEEDTIELF